jgi:hypothetical protein
MAVAVSSNDIRPVFQERPANVRRKNWPDAGKSVRNLFPERPGGCCA